MEHVKATLPFFPLDIAILPNEEVKLHIFEPRYLQLVRDCKESGMNFGIPFVAHSDMAGYGTEVALKKIVKLYHNGSMDILVEGVATFMVLKYMSVMPNKLYAGGRIAHVKRDFSVESPELLNAYRVYNELANERTISYSFLNPITTFDIGNDIHLSNLQKYRLISTADKSDQESYLLSKVAYINVLLEQEQRTEQGIYLS